MKTLLTLLVLTISMEAAAQYTSPQDIAIYKQLADSGDITAMGYLGDLYSTGQEKLPRDCALALHYYRQALAAGDSSYLIRLGRYYLDGVCTTPGYDTASAYFLTAADHHIAQGYFNTGILYEAGMHGRPDYDSALAWYFRTATFSTERTSQEGTPTDGGYLLFDFLYAASTALRQSDTLHRLPAIDIPRTLHAFTAAAAKGDKYAMMALYIAYLHGDGIAVDSAAARKYLVDAANAGNVYAMYHLGLSYYSLAARSDATAEKWLLRAAAKDYVPALTHLAIVYYYGAGVKQDSKKAMEFYLKAANRGDALAMTNLGVACMTGQGAQVDFKKGIEWLTKAADLHSVNAMFYLGRAYDFGAGTNQDYALAMYWYLKAAAHGNETAYNSIGKLYEDGKGVPVDYKKAVYWYSKMHKR